MTRAFTAETKGYFKLDHTPEELLENWSKIGAEEDYTIPDGAGDNVILTLDQMRDEGLEVSDLSNLPEFSREK